MRKRAVPGSTGRCPRSGSISARLLIVVGLAPGLRGANRTGRPFTGDYAGDLLYETLSISGLRAAAMPPSLTMASNWSTA